ncbi:MAG TPA: hypothetical protein VMR96_03225 [Solirubrobacterales bacterium]|nr:hypothetical protein [Solirubrobacterales bacterium]
MRALRGIGVVGVLLIALIGVSSASAATEAGDDCVANTQEGIYTLVPIKRVSPSALPLTAPVGGVVTSWKVHSGVSEAVPEQMRVLRPTGNPNEFLTVGESTEQTVVEGVNVFPTRIPVQAGDHFGVFGTVQDVVFCGGADPGDVSGLFLISAAVGSVRTFNTENGAGVRIPMIAVIEPDRDGDGYGDETQDKCPQSAAYQGPCPTITLDAFPIALKRSVLVLVSASETSSVQVFGQVSWKPRHKGGALASKTRKPGDHKSAGVIVGLAGGTQTVSPGQVARFNVKLPNSVKRQLRQVPPGKSLKGTITARTTDLAGRVTDRVVNIRLRGQGRTQP